MSNALESDGLNDRRLMGPVSGVLWLCAAIVGGACQALPGVPHPEPVITWILVVFAGAYGLACARGWIHWEAATLRHHALAVLVSQPFLVLAIWCSGGAHSYLSPILVLAMLYVAYFFPPRMAWWLAGAEVLTYLTPLAYDDGARHGTFLARGVTFAVSYAALAYALRHLKGHLVGAERHQRQMANRDPLTGLANRRAFDAALARTLAAAGRPEHGRRAGDEHGRFAVLLADVDAFKAINDGYGHTTGDRVLRELAAHASAGVRPGDCLARIGGDELAVVAPGAGEAGARRLAASLAHAAECVRPDGSGPPVSLTISWALFPDDGDSTDALMRTADARLYDVKRARSGWPVASRG